LEIVRFSSNSAEIKNIIGHDKRRIFGPSSQVYRVTDRAGESLEEEKQAERVQPPLSQEDVLYAEMDSSML
jgi:hypothetical protein